MNGPKTRVAHVSESLDMGGLEKLLVEFARHADRDRFDLRFYTLGGPGDLAGEVAALGWPVVALGMPTGLRPRATFRLARDFRRAGVDVVHTHSEGPMLYAAPAARLAGARRIVHTRHHGPDLGNNSRKARAAVVFLARWVDRIVCVAEDGARASVAEGFPAGRVVTLRNGIDLSRFAYGGPTPGGPAVIVARLSVEKDHACLLHAAAIVAARAPGFRLEIAGDGPCLPDLRALSDTLGLSASVRFLGRVDDVPALLGRASLLVLSSRLEGISLTLLEAMARGLPVVATRVGGNPEVVLDGATGLLVPPRSPTDLADAILTLWRDPGLSRRMGQAGRERAERHFDIKTSISKYEKIYAQPSRTFPRRVAAGALA